MKITDDLRALYSCPGFNLAVSQGKIILYFIYLFLCSDRLHMQESNDIIALHLK